MTENEAKEKWCPLFRATVSDSGALCIGSECMLWRWEPKWKATKAGPIRIGDSEHGYCGLAKEP